jgi:hypothetical protein
LITPPASVTTLIVYCPGAVAGDVTNLRIRAPDVVPGVKADQYRPDESVKQSSIRQLTAC